MSGRAGRGRLPKKTQPQDDESARGLPSPTNSVTEYANHRSSTPKSIGDQGQPPAPSGDNGYVNPRAAARPPSPANNAPEYVNPRGSAQNSGAQKNDDDDGWYDGPATSTTGSQYVNARGGGPPTPADSESNYVNHRGSGGPRSQADSGSGYENHRGQARPSSPTSNDGNFNSRNQSRPTYGNHGSGYRNDRGSTKEIWDRGDSGQRGDCMYCQGNHFASDCPNKPQRDRGPPKCYKCQEIGHMSRDCPNGDSQYGRDNNRGEPRGRQGGHYGREDNYHQRSPGNRSSGPLRCENCEGKGHTASQCPSAPMNEGQGGGGGYGRSPPRGYDSRNSYDQRRPNGASSGYGSDHSQGGYRGENRESTHAYDGSGGNRGRSGYGGDYDNGRRGDRTGNDSRDSQKEIVCRKCNKSGHAVFSCPDDDQGPYRNVIKVTEEDVVNRNKTGINFERYEKINVKVVDSEGRPNPSFESHKLRTFEDAKLSRELLEVLRKAGYDQPTPVQRYAIPIALAGRDLIACAQTGSGKTAAFVLPTMQTLLDSYEPANEGPQSPFALILAPTRELVIQITKDAKSYGIRTDLQVKECYGGTHVGVQIRNIRQGCHILVGTTGRVKDFLEKGVVRLDRLKFLVFDEADRMLDMGFVNDIEDIGKYFSRNPRKPQTLMFSATFKDEVQRLAKRFLADNFLKLEVGLVGAANEDVAQEIEEISGFNRKKERLKELIEEDMAMSRDAKILVFVETKKTADFIASYLSEVSQKTTSIHGDRFQQQRETALKDFQTGDCSVLVATSVAARGLDITGVTHVINFDMPKEDDEYVHRVGRTGRVGNRGRATSFFDGSKDGHLRERLREILLDAGTEPPAFL